MKTDWNILGPEGLKFFGKITSTTTHDLNNIIGIINENAGLLEDLGWMAKQGTPPDIDQWIQIGQKISAQVQRAHETIKNLNNFAHSTDHTRARVNPDTLLALVAFLSKRLLAEKMVTAQLVPAEESLEIETCPFLFLNLVGTCLVFAADHADQNKKIVIHTRQDSKKLSVSFSGIVVENCRPFPSKSVQQLLKALDASMQFITDQNCMRVFIYTHKPAAEKIND
jgi:hypothetical protein